MTTADCDIRQALGETVARLLGLLDALEQVGRHLNPVEGVSAEALGDDEAALRAADARLAGCRWPETLLPLREPLGRSTEAALRAADGLRSAASQGDFRLAYRALRQASRAQEALYPLAAVLPTVSRFFVEPERRDDIVLLERLASPARPADLSHVANATSDRGGYSVFVPEDYNSARAYPLIMALHGGAGHGRLFLWSWLREARTRGVVLVAPTAVGDTWSLMDPALDSANLQRILDAVARDWHIDAAHLLLTGMSDGGTFTLLSGLDEDSPFTHLAPVAASFHPLLLTMTDPRRVMGLPIYLTHGVLDWMFPVSVARTARQALTAAGARVTYREVADLAHTYPRDENGGILHWFLDRTG